MRTPLTLAIGLILLLTGCAGPAPEVGTAIAVTVLPATISFGTSLPFPTTGPDTPIPTLPSGLSPAELKYRLLEEFPDFFFCDPDYYPIPREDEGELARQRFPELQADVEEFQVILKHTGLGGLTFFSDEQKLLVYREHKKLAALEFELAGDKYEFQLQTQSQDGQGFVISGLIDGAGSIKALDRHAGIAACPICLAAHTLIDTPRGPVAVENLHPGDPVWTAADAAHRRVAGTLLKVGRTFVPESHRVVHLVLDDGRQLWASPGHPDADGRRLGNLKVGDLLDGAHIVQVELVQYSEPATYDLLPSGETGFYWADGILLGSTLVNR